MSKPSKLDHAQRRREIADYYATHGAPATATKFGISRARVYDLLKKMQYPTTIKRRQT